MNLPFLFAILRSETTLSRVRALCPSFDEPLELDESDESLSDPLEPDEPVPCKSKIKIGIVSNIEIVIRLNLPEPDELERFRFCKLLLFGNENEIGLRGGGAGGEA